jgi:hypothetical protein
MEEIISGFLIITMIVATILLRYYPRLGIYIHMTWIYNRELRGRITNNWFLVSVF